MESIKIDVHRCTIPRVRIRKDVWTRLSWSERRRRQTGRYLGHRTHKKTLKRTKVQKKKKTSGTFWRSLSFFLNSLSLRLCVCFKYRQTGPTEKNPYSEKRRFALVEFGEILVKIMMHMLARDTHIPVFSLSFLVLKDLPDSGGKKIIKKQGLQDCMTCLFCLEKEIKNHAIGGDMRKKGERQEEKGRWEMRVARVGRQQGMRHIRIDNLCVLDWILIVDTKQIREREREGEGDALCSTCIMVLLCTWMLLRVSLLGRERKRNEGKEYIMHTQNLDFLTNKSSSPLRSAWTKKNGQKWAPTRVRERGWGSEYSSSSLRSPPALLIFMHNPKAKEGTYQRIFIRSSKQNIHLHVHSQHTWYWEVYSFGEEKTTTKKKTSCMHAQLAMSWKSMNWFRARFGVGCAWPGIIESGTRHN